MLPKGANPAYQDGYSRERLDPPLLTSPKSGSLARRRFPLPDEEFFIAPMPALDSWRSASGSGPGGNGGADDSGSDWFIRPEDVVICKDPRGNDWQLGSGAYGSVRLPFKCTCPSTEMICPGIGWQGERYALSQWHWQSMTWPLGHSSSACTSWLPGTAGSQLACSSECHRFTLALQRSLLRARRCTRACCRAARLWR